MKFEAKKEVAFIMPLLIPATIALVVSLYFVIKSESIIALVGLLLSLALCYGIYYFWTHTYYEIKSEKLHYYSISFKGSVPINKIKRVENTDYPAAGNRPALSFTGITIFYGAGNELFISPKDADLLLTQLKAVNKRIKVSG